MAGQRSSLLLLDIDGTLCPLGSGPNVAMKRLSVGSSAVAFGSDLPELLDELALRYELVWATAWQDHANLLLGPALGLPALPVIRFSAPGVCEGEGYGRRTWKLPSVERFAGDRPLAWIDDDVHGDAFAWAATRRILTKVLGTDPNRGITDDHVRALLGFARHLAAPSPHGTAIRERTADGAGNLPR